MNWRESTWRNGKIELNRRGGCRARYFQQSSCFMISIEAGFVREIFINAKSIWISDSVLIIDYECYVDYWIEWSGPCLNSFKKVLDFQWEWIWFDYEAPCYPSETMVIGELETRNHFKCRLTVIWLASGWNWVRWRLIWHLIDGWLDEWQGEAKWWIGRRRQHGWKWKHWEEGRYVEIMDNNISQASLLLSLSLLFSFFSSGFSLLNIHRFHFCEKVASSCWSSQPAPAHCWFNFKAVKRLDNLSPSNR